MIKYKSPLLVVKNIKKSKKFYEKILEQKVKNDEGGFVFLESGFVIQSQENFEKTVNKNNINTWKLNLGTECLRSLTFKVVCFEI